MGSAAPDPQSGFLGPGVTALCCGQLRTLGSCMATWLRPPLVFLGSHDATSARQTDDPLPVAGGGWALEISQLWGSAPLQCCAFL